MLSKSFVQMDLNRCLKRLGRLYLLFILLLLGGASAIATADEQPLTLIQGVLGLKKLNNVQDGKVISGFKYDLIEEIGRRLDLPTEHRLCPFQRCLRDMKNGSINIMVFIAVTPERSHFMDFVQIWPIPYTVPFFVRRGEENRLQRYEDLHQLNVGVVNGYLYFSTFDTDSRIQKTTVQRETQLPKMLSVNRIDAYVGFNIDFAELHKKYPDITAAPYTHQFTETALLAISQSSPLNQKLPQLESVIEAMIKDDTLNKIWAKNLPGYSLPYPKSASETPESNPASHEIKTDVE